jgi:hypothetical protein
MGDAILVHFTPKEETFNRFRYVWPNERSSKSKKIFIGAVQKWLKTQAKKLFSDRI